MEKNIRNKEGILEIQEGYQKLRRIFEIQKEYLKKKKEY